MTASPLGLLLATRHIAGESLRYFFPGQETRVPVQPNPVPGPIRPGPGVPGGLKRVNLEVKQGYLASKTAVLAVKPL